jgi:hypothetical protein
MNRIQGGNMKKTGKLIALAVALMTLIGTSAFADSRRQDETWRGGSNRRNESNRGYRDNERVTVEGRISSFSRERDGYRVNLDRGGYSYWLPSSRLRGRDLRVGVSIRLAGVFRRGVVYVDDLGYPGAYDNGNVRGVVERIDDRRGLLTLRDEYSGRFVTVDMVRADRRSRIGLDDLRRGDYVTLAGDWTRGGIFEAYRVDSVRTGRY